MNICLRKRLQQENKPYDVAYYEALNDCFNKPTVTTYLNGYDWYTVNSFINEQYKLELAAWKRKLKSESIKLL